MANYYTRSVITGPVLLSPNLVAVLSARGAELDCIEEETVLDGIVAERMPLGLYTVAFENGWTDPCEDVDEFLIEYAGWDDADVEAATTEFRELVIADEVDILREVLKLNPDADCIDMQSSWSCSKMRLDGFGGSGLILTKLGFLYITSSNYAIAEDGSLCLASAFTPWEEYDEKSAAVSEVTDVSA